MSANAEIIAELRRVLNERDEARRERDELVAQRTRMAEQIATLDRNAETFLADAGRMRETNDYLRTWLSSEELEGLRVKAAEHPLLWEEIHHLKAEVERLRAEAAPMNEHFTAGYRDGYRDAYRRGAEAMREACAVRAQRYLGLLIVEGAKTAEAIRNLPIPEEP